MAEDVFYRHQLKIARATIKLSEVGARIMGGMTMAEAEEFMAKHKSRVRQGGATCRLKV